MEEGGGLDAGAESPIPGRAPLSSLSLSRPDAALAQVLAQAGSYIMGLYLHGYFT